MRKIVFTSLAWLNKRILPSFTKQKLDLARAKKWQLALIGWRYFITKNALDYSKDE